MKCPTCGLENSNEPFKSWQFGTYLVKRVKCSECGENFNIYVGEGKSFTIPKRIDGDLSGK